MKFNIGLLRFKIILEIKMGLSLINFVYFGMLPASEIQRWLVAIQCRSGNQNDRCLKKIIFFGMPLGSDIKRWLVVT